MTDKKKSSVRGIRRLLWVVLFLGLTVAAFVTIGSLWAQVVSATWARWLLTVGTSLGVPLFVAALLAGRVREGRELAVLSWSLLVVLALGAGVPWLVARQRTSVAVARDGLWLVESIVGERSPETRRSWADFFAGPGAVQPTQVEGAPVAAPPPATGPARPKPPAVGPGPADGGSAAPRQPPATAPPADAGKSR